jgi:uncharacterized membrane protein YraQ (UPF0718 family)
MREVFASLVEILRESAPYLILGFALAGIFHIVLQRFPRITAALTGSGARPIFLAALIGAPMPLCSCSVMPAALTLRRQGASKGTTASFLVSVPETDIVSILMTFALIGPFFAVYRPLAAVAIALTTGLVIRSLEQREHQRHVTASTQSSSTTVDGCCEEPPIVSGAHPSHAPSPARSWILRAFVYGFVEVFDDIVPQLFLGIVIAAIISVLLPEVSPQLVQGHKFLSYLIMGAAGIPAYVCAAASTPIAAGLIAGGVSPGAAMVFLLVGPATNLASLVVMRSMFGARLLTVYLAMIAVTSVALGALLDLLIGKINVNPIPHVHHHGGNSMVPTVFMCVFLLWTLISFHRSRLVWRMRDGLSRRLTARPSMK